MARVPGLEVGQCLEQVLLASLTASTAETVTGSGITGFGGYKQAQIALIVTNAAAAAGDTLDVFIDTSLDGGSTWLNVVHFTQVLGNGADSLKFVATLDPAGAAGTSVVATTSDAAAGAVRPSMFGDQLRVRYTVVDGGAHGQSFTFSVVGTFKV